MVALSLRQLLAEKLVLPKQLRHQLPQTVVPNTVWMQENSYYAITTVPIALRRLPFC